ncbi:interferon-induced, double-stranded RNA-activated protein kinase-like isoform X2 [Rhinoderma darwinii]|uniref:interferon-induced, double-stranded RNA-activated protein kinase-like isoform X2 n=1 Tax=Rhinoderma darwinii TaxID=43563 RepID=UPI003F67448A
MEKNCKGLLIEFCIKNSRSQPRFEMPEATGPPHDRVFVCQVFIDDKLVGEAKDKTKKSAENTAAKMALQALGKRNVIHQPDYIALLNTYSQEKKQAFNFVPVSCVGPAHNPEFTYRVKSGDRLFPTSSAKRSKKQAQKAAAYLALQEIRREFPNEIPELPEGFIDESGSENSSLSESAGGDISGNRSRSENGFSDSASATSEYQQDPVALLHHFCQTQKWILDFLDGGQTGPAHNRQFSCKAKTEQRSFPESNMRKTKKLARKEAAFLALKELKSEFPSDIPDLPKVFVDDSSKGQSSAPSPGPSSESGMHMSLTPNSQLSSSSSGLAPSSVQNPLGEFDNITELDRGAYGKVVKARKILDEKLYAVKIVQVKGNKVLEEVKALARLEHQNIVRYNTAWLGKDDFSDSSESSSYSSDLSRKSYDCLYIQMELCENGSLKRWIKKMNKVNKSESFNIFRQIIEGVKYIHSQKLIHRDLKPANIFFTKDMVVKIGDFGLVTQMTGEEEKKAHERTRRTGTPTYMAPEQEWSNVREGEFPSGFEEQNPVEKYEICKMLSHDPEKRPLAEELCRSFHERKTFDSQTR